MSKEDKKGWFSSIIVHLMLALVLFLSKVDETRTEPGFVEVSWGTPSPISMNAAPSLSRSAGAMKSSQNEIVKKALVDLPERTPGFNSEDMPLPKTRKSVVEEQYTPGKAKSTDATRDRNVAGVGSEDQGSPLATNGAGESGKLPGSGLSAGGGTGKSVAYSMQWGDGGTRRLLVGDLPKYPEGVTVEAQIKIEAVIMPNGKVRAMRPVQKGNIRLEENSMKEVKNWIFEPLGSSTPQSDQICLITFNFVLR